jgi:hypothetical protein
MRITTVILILVSLIASASAQAETRRQRVITHTSLIPVYFFAGIFIHESSHTVAAEILGFEINEFKPYPHRREDGMFFLGRINVDLPDEYQNDNPDARWAAMKIAPHVTDAFLFATSDILLSTAIEPDSHAAPWVFMAGMVVPWIDLFFSLIGDENDLSYFSRYTGVDHGAILAVGYAIVGFMTYRVIKHFVEIFVRN